MSHYISRIILLIVTCSTLQFSYAQQDPEFPKGFIVYAKLHSGMVTDFTSHPDLFVGGIQLTPQYTVVPHLLRAGIIAGSFYGAKKIQGEFGPVVSINPHCRPYSLQKLKTIAF